MDLGVAARGSYNCFWRQSQSKGLLYRKAKAKVTQCVLRKTVIVGVHRSLKIKSVDDWVGKP